MSISPSFSRKKDKASFKFRRRNLIYHDKELLQGKGTETLFEMNPRFLMIVSIVNIFCWLDVLGIIIDGILISITKFNKINSLIKIDSF